MAIHRLILPALSAALVLFGAPASASEPIQLTDSPGADRHPDWSPDGSYLVFESNRSGDWHIYRINPDGTGEVQLTFGPLDQMHPEISPDGLSLVYIQGTATLSGSTSSTSIEIVDLSGDAPVRTLVPNTGRNNWHPGWSADGALVYFDRANSTWDIYRIPSNGGTEEPVVDRATDAFVSVSRDQAWIAYMSGPGSGPYNIFQAPSAAPMTATQLTFESSNTVPDDYSPDGTRLVYDSRKVQGRLELFELELATGISTRLTFDAETSPTDPVNRLADYSPDGAWIAFSSSRVAGNENLWLLPMAGQPPSPNVLDIGDGRGLPGPGPVIVPVFLRSSQSSPALEFRLADVPDWLRVTDALPTGRAGSMTASFVDDGNAHVLLYSSDRSVIPAGTGKILDLVVQVKPTAPEGDSASLALTDPVFSDVDGLPLPIEVEGGMFWISRLDGDVNGDNLVDVGDLVRLVEIILGTGDPATPEELTAADCNQDAAHNALDIPCLVDLILGGGSAAPSFVAASASGNDPGDLVFSMEEEVRGIQFVIPAGDPLPTTTAEMAPFELRTCVSGPGRIAMAFDPEGRGWTEGRRAPLRVGSIPAEVRAYGPGGRPLPVSVGPEGVRIGKPIPSGLVLGAPTRNPFRASTEIRFSIDRAARIEVSVYDIRGARVAVLPSKTVAAGHHVWPWDARDDQGRALPAGVYIALVEGNGLRGAVRLTHLGR